MSEKNVSKSFITGAMIIAFSHIIVKFIGALFRIPLANMIKPEGMAVYQASYSIYLVLFIISTAGLPVAISKMVSSNEAVGNKEKVQKILKVSFWLLLVIGIVGTIILLTGAKNFAAMVGIPDDYLAIVALAPSLLFVSLSSVYRGYFQGHQNMFPTAISEVIEALFKLFVGLILAGLLLSKGAVFAASGGILGVTIGSMFSAVFLVFYYFSYRKNKRQLQPRFERGEFLQILKTMVWIAVPITIGSSIFSLTNMIDTAMIMRRLQGIGYSEEASKVMFGYYSGYAITLFNLPATVIVGLSISIVPAISMAMANRNRIQARDSIASAVRISWQVAFPAGIGLAVLASPILHLLFKDTDFILPMNASLPDSLIFQLLGNNQDATRLLTLLGLAIGLVCVTMVTNAVLQALDRVWLPVINMVIGGTVKVISNLILIGIPELNVMGAPISTTLCYLTTISLNLICIHNVLKVNYGFMDTIIKPLISVVAMGFTAIFSYNFLIEKFPLVIATAVAICAAGAVYMIFMFLLKAFRKSDMELMPKGEKLIKILGRFLG